MFRVKRIYYSLILIILLVQGCQEPPSKSGFSSILMQDGEQVTFPANLQFPRDHLAHPEFGIEWWYLTANLKTADDAPLWLQWTLFRIKGSQPENNWSDGQFYMAHFSLHDEKQHVFHEMFADGGVGNVEIDERHIQINNWQLKKTPEGLPSELKVSFPDSQQGDNVTIHLQMHSKEKRILHGKKGYSLKHPETNLASYYYSLPNIDVKGSTYFSGERHQINGYAWYDHEWSSAFLSDDFSGWTWFSIHLEDNAKLTLFTLIPTDFKAFQPAWYGAYLAANGDSFKLSDEDIKIVENNWYDSQIGRLPIAWQLQIDKLDLSLNIKTKKTEQISAFSIPYYEGAIDVSGSIKGVGFVEQTR